MISGAVVFYLGLCSNTAHIMEAREIGQERRGRNFIGVGRFEFRGDIGFARGPSSILSAVRSYGSGQQIDEALFAGTVSRAESSNSYDGCVCRRTATCNMAVYQFEEPRDRNMESITYTPLFFYPLPSLFELLTVRDTVGKSLFLT